MDFNEKMAEYAASLTSGADRALAFRVSQLPLRSRSIAQALVDDHRNTDGHMRAGKLVVAAGLGEYTPGKNSQWGRFAFVDGSSMDVNGVLNGESDGGANAEVMQ